MYKLDFMAVFMKSYGAEVVVDCWDIIYDVGYSRIMF